MGRSPADDASAARAAGFEALRRRFVGGLHQRWREIEGAADPAARASALHRLAGAAGSFGYEELGRAARAAERLAAGEPGPAFTVALDEVDRLLREIAAS